MSLCWSITPPRSIHGPSPDHNVSSTFCPLAISLPQRFSICEGCNKRRVASLVRRTPEKLDVDIQAAKGWIATYRGPDPINGWTNRRDKVNAVDGRGRDARDDVVVVEARTADLSSEVNAENFAPVVEHQAARVAFGAKDDETTARATPCLGRLRRGKSNQGPTDNRNIVDVTRLNARIDGV